MNEDKIKRMLDACYLAKRIRELLPELPEAIFLMVHRTINWCG